LKVLSSYFSKSAVSESIIGPINEVTITTTPTGSLQFFFALAKFIYDIFFSDPENDNNNTTTADNTPAELNLVSNHFYINIEILHKNILFRFQVLL
jgi:hypothetical protein